MIASPFKTYVFISLNIVRILSLIACILVFASNIVVFVNDVRAIQRAPAALVFDPTTNTTSPADPHAANMTDCDYLMHSTVPNQPAGAFWAISNRLLILFEVIVLVLSELGWPMAFFNRWFPILGNEYGVGALGVFQCLIGASILSHHIPTFALVSAFFLFSIGCLNIFLGLVFRETSKTRRSITSWRDRAVPKLPIVNEVTVKGMSGPPSFVSAVWDGTKASQPGQGGDASPAPSFGSKGFGRQAEKAAGLKGFLISKPLDTLPRYAPKISAPIFGNAGQQ